ncbi:MAG: hypothetical protein JNM52_08670 [Betaproteobacteria bacterium]|nr:hypothetical protein [Betaproteobacteria bacterium]
MRHKPDLPTLLNLRYQQQRVSLMRLNGETRIQIGISHPVEDTRRADAIRAWGTGPATPRQTAPPVSIDEPLPQRTQTLLSYRLHDEAARALRPGAAPAQQADVQSAAADSRIKVSIAPWSGLD